MRSGLGAGCLGTGKGLVVVAKVGSALTGGSQPGMASYGRSGRMLGAQNALNPECPLEASWLGIVSGVSALSAYV